jgi:hypothetical protein
MNDIKKLQKFETNLQCEREEKNRLGQHITDISAISGK